MTTMSRAVPLTDAKGHWLVLPDERIEPNEGSIVLTNGPYGTAWQRFYSDGLWHRVGGGHGRPWDDLLRANRNVVLVYDTPERSE